MRRTLAAALGVLWLVPLAAASAAEPDPAASAAPEAAAQPAQPAQPAPAPAAQPAPAAAAPKLSAKEILDRMDKNNNDFADQTLEERLTVVDVDGTKKSYDLVVQQKGDVKRLITFVSGEMKGMANLVEDKGSVYVYLPGFKKVRRVAAHNMNQTLAGSDLSNEDSSITSWGRDWEPKLDKEDETSYWLTLTPKPGHKSEYAKVVHRIDKKLFFQAETHYYNAAGEKTKQMINTEPTDWGTGKYWKCKIVTVTDVRTGHKTILETKSFKANTGLKDELFTVRHLQWGK